MRVGPLGVQPRSSLVRALVAARSIAKKVPIHPKWSCTSSESIEATGRSNARPIGSAIARVGAPSSATVCRRVPARQHQRRAALGRPHGRRRRNRPARRGGPPAAGQSRSRSTEEPPPGGWTSPWPATSGSRPRPPSSVRPTSTSVFPRATAARGCFLASSVRAWPPNSCSPATSSMPPEHSKSGW